MTPEQQRIALYTWAGWSHYHEDLWVPPGITDFSELDCDCLPDCLNDLNAVHELEKKLTDTQYVQWALALNELWLRDNPYSIPNRIGIFRSASATAAQRCEALLKTLNLWKP